MWETEKNFSTDLQLLMTETTNDPILLKTLVCLERQQQEMIPDEYQMVRRKLSSRFGLVFMEDRIRVPKNLRTTVISLLHKGHPAINKMTLAARHFLWPKMTEAIQKKCETCIPCKMSGKSIKPNIPSTEKISYHRCIARTKKSNWISSDQSRTTTVDFIYYCPLTGTANGRQPAFVNIPTGKRHKNFLNNTFS